MNDLKQISAPSFIEEGVLYLRYPWHLASLLLFARGCGHSTILGAAHKSSPRDLICRT